MLVTAKLLMPPLATWFNPQLRMSSSMMYQQHVGQLHTT
jgi:hypothetical protein